MNNPQKMEITATTLYPRCLGNALKNINQNITVVGQIKSIDQQNQSFKLEYDPQSKQTLEILVPLSQDINDFKAIKFIEVRGFLSNHGEVTLRSYTDFKDNFDLPTYNEMLRLATNQFRNLFNY